MKVECPECHVWFKIGDQLVKSEGSKARCSKCKAVFIIYPDLETGSEPQEELLAEEEFPGQEDESQQFSADEEIAYDTSVVDTEFANTEDGKSSRKKNRVLFLFLFLVLIAVGGATAWFGYPLVQEFLQKSAPKQEEPVKGDPASAPQPVTNKELVEKIILEDVRQYFVENEKTGQLFVVEGKVVNGFDDPRELLRLRATLYEEQGKFFLHKDFYAGNVISLFQLQILSQEELEAGLNAKVGILSNNINVQPGKKVAFMTVFFNLPQHVREFGLEVIDAKKVK